MPKQKDFIHKLTENINKKELPGIIAHKKMAPEGRFDDLAQIGQSKAVKSAVLILLHPDNQGLQVVFIKRATYNGHHSGQIAFPGGKFEPFDNNLIETAIREANEEIGILKKDFQVIGSLSNIYIPHSNYMVSPFVAYMNDLPHFIINKSEVEQVITISLDKFIDDACLSTLQIEINGNLTNAPCWIIDNTCIWGATAMIMSEFIEILGN